MATVCEPCPGKTNANLFCILILYLNYISKYVDFNIIGLGKDNIVESISH
jgi:hypothetical protein